MESSTISQVVEGAEVTGCPVMHQDFSTTRNLGDYWALANELRESCPHFYNKYSGGGYWVFTRHEAVKDIYKTPEIFSSESITPWEPNPIYRFVPTAGRRARSHQVPPHPQPVVLAEGDGGGGTDDAGAVQELHRAAGRQGAGATSSRTSRCCTPPRRS